MSLVRRVLVDARVNLENKRLHVALTKYRTSVCCGSGCSQAAHGRVTLLNRAGVYQPQPGKGLEFNALCLQIGAAVSQVFKVDLIPCRLQRAEPGNVKQGSSGMSISAQHCVRWIFRLSLVSTDAVSPSCGVTDTGH